MSEINDSGFNARAIPTQVDCADAENIYKRWTAGTVDEWILRVSIAADVVSYGRAYGLWTDRATLTYDAIIRGA